MNLYKQKWQKFLSRIWLFNFIPFVDFVLAAGSLATGDTCPPHKNLCGGINENSDFDVIVGVRQGRIFTTRAFCILVFGMLGWRRKKYSRHSHEFVDLHRYKDKICLNHFVTPNAYRLSPPYNEYWKMLYQKLVPVYGDPAAIQKFQAANQEWTGPVRGRARAQARSEGPFGRATSNGMEWFLSGRFGDWIEQKLRTIQIKKIEKSLKSENLYHPRIIYNDNELEFHPDTRRIEELLHENKL